MLGEGRGGGGGGNCGQCERACVVAEPVCLRCGTAGRESVCVGVFGVGQELGLG